MRRFAGTGLRTGLAVVGVLVLLGAGAWAVVALAGNAPPPGGPIPPLPVLQAVLYDAGGGAVDAWTAADGTTRHLLPATIGRKLLTTSADGSFLVYLDPDPPVTSTRQVTIQTYQLHVWSDGIAAQTAPIPGGVSTNLAAQFSADGDLAVLLHAASTRPGPLYLYTPDAGLLRPVVPSLESFALGRGVIAYARDTGKTSIAQRQNLPVHAVGTLDLAGASPATDIISFTVAQDTFRPVRLYYEPAHDAFIYTAARSTGLLGRNVTMALGMIPPDGPGSDLLPLQTNDDETALAFSSSGRSLLYAHGPIGPDDPLPVPRLAALTWLSNSLQIAQDTDVTLPGGLRVEAAQFMRGRDWLVVSALRPGTPPPSSPRAGGVPVLDLFDPASGHLETVLDGSAGTLLAVLDESHLLLAATSGGGAGTVPVTTLVLAERSAGTWRTRPLGTPLAGEQPPRFVGLLPGGAALVYIADAVRREAAFYRVPLDGSPRTAVAQLALGGAYFPITQP